MRKRTFWVILALIVLLGVLLRLKGFEDRFLFSSDTARDLLVARGAIIEHQLPWVGSFSSAGPFVFGPNYYWFLMLSLLVFPSLFLGPWILLFSISVFFIIVMGLIGLTAKGRVFGLLLALLTATSPLIVGFSTALTQHTLVEASAGLVLLGFLAYAKSQRLRFAFLGAAGLGAAISLHFQGLNLLIYLPLFFIFVERKPIKVIQLGAVLTLGLLVFLLPTLLWDQTRNFRNLEQLIYYFRVGQYRFWVSNRWLFYLGQFWPGFLGKILGVPPVGGIVGGIGIVLLILWGMVRKRIDRLSLLVIGVFLVQIVVLRYFRGEKFDGYLIYFHPILLFVIGLAVEMAVRRWKYVGGTLLFAVAVLGVSGSRQYWNLNNQISSLRILTNLVSEKYPNEKVALYGRGLSSSNASYSLSYVLSDYNLESDNGRPLGLCRFGYEACDVGREALIGEADYQGDHIALVDLSNVPVSELSKQNEWYPFSVLAVYDDVQNWWRKGIVQ